MEESRFDVVILGAGLAGLGVAKQILQARPETRLCLIEKGRFPRPEAIAKVGESTVEIGSHYLLKRLGLGEHLSQQQIRKFGLRLFMGGVQDIESCDELGGSRVFGLPTYQIDRGVLENLLYRDVLQRGAVVLQEHTPTALSIQAGETQHSVSLDTGVGERTLHCRWLVDAAGRAGLIKNELGLAKPSAHRGNAVWFRVAERIALDDWSAEHQWTQRCKPSGERWRSTNHLTGPGYWVWIIPLACGATSFGIVMDDEVYQNHDFSNYEQALAWLEREQPQCASALSGTRLLDYVALADYSYDCRRVFSEDHWAITGEAGRFADPFYSPGTDFIAMANDFIVDLVSEDLAGRDIRLSARLCDGALRAIFDNTLSLYTGQYGGFGDRVLMSAKLLWDYAYYWGVLCVMYFDGTLARAETLKQYAPTLFKAQQLNQQAQALFRQRAQKRMQLPPQAMFIDQYTVPCLHDFNKILASGEAGLSERYLEQNTAVLAALMLFVEDILSDHPSSDITEQEAALLGHFRYAVCPDLCPQGIVLPSAAQMPAACTMSSGATT